MGEGSRGTSEPRADVATPADLLPQGKVGCQFCEALKAHIEGRPQSEQKLIQSIRIFATAARELSLPPERTIVVLKQLFHDVCSVLPNQEQLAERELLERVVAWCIENYYST